MQPFQSNAAVRLEHSSIPQAAHLGNSNECGRTLATGSGITCCLHSTMFRIPVASSRHIDASSFHAVHIRFRLLPHIAVARSLRIAAFVVCMLLLRAHHSMSQIASMSWCQIAAHCFIACALLIACFSCSFASHCRLCYMLCLLAIAAS